MVRVDPDEALVDIGAKSEGIISNREISGRNEAAITLTPGDLIKVYVLQPEDDEGRVILSLRKARAESICRLLPRRSRRGKSSTLRSASRTRAASSSTSWVSRIPAQQPGGASVLRQPHGAGRHQDPVKILEVNRERNRLIVSQRAAQDEDRARQREELFEKLKVSDVITGKVSGLTSYGAFVNLGGADGLIHISELSWDRINNVSDMLNVGDEVRVKVIKLDPELSRISLSLRQMQRGSVGHRSRPVPPGKMVEGEVTKTKKYGAFLQIADSIEGLLAHQQLSWDHVERTEDVLKVGEKVNVMVLSADRTRRRISLSLRQLHGGGPEGPASTSRRPTTSATMTTTRRPATRPRPSRTRRPPRSPPPRRPRRRPQSRRGGGRGHRPRRRVGGRGDLGAGRRRGGCGGARGGARGARGGARGARGGLTTRRDREPFPSPER